MRTNVTIPPEWIVEILAVMSGILGKEADKSFDLITHLAGRLSNYKRLPALRSEELCVEMYNLDDLSETEFLHSGLVATRTQICLRVWRMVMVLKVRATRALAVTDM